MNTSSFFRGTVLPLLFICLNPLVFGERALTVTVEANSAAMFRLSGNHDVVAFVQEDPEAVIEIVGSINGHNIRRYVDNDATLASGNRYIEFFTMAQLNFGELPLAVYPESVSVTLRTIEPKPNLFPSADLFNEASEIDRIAAVETIADTYLSNPLAREVTKQAAAVPLRVLRGETLPRNEDGTPVFFHELMAITSGHPRSYKLTPELRAAARAAGTAVSPDTDTFEAKIEDASGQAKLEITLLGPKGVKTVGVPHARLRDLVQDTVAPRLFNTGNAYPDPNMEVYRTFRLPGKTQKAVSLKQLAKALVRKYAPGKLSVEDVAIEVTAYNGYTWNFRNVDPEVFLLVPKVQVDEPLFLACCNNVDADGKPVNNAPLGVFGVQSINLISLK